MEDIAATSTSLPQYELVSRGKVRDIYSLSPTALLFIATDRISAYDVILSNGIPGKGKLLTQLSAFWFQLLSEKMPSLKTHLITTDLPSLSSRPDAPADNRPRGMIAYESRVLDHTRPPTLSPEQETQLRGRSMQVRKLKILPIESIVRGYITGSAWSEYRKSGTVHGMPMPAGLRESEKLPTPIWTPSTKAEQGQHDENISAEKAAEIIGQAYADKVRDLSLQIYSTAAAYAEERGIIIADTKFEFGVEEDTGDVVLVDEVLTPDSSRFWDKGKYEVGRAQGSLDKQFLRDWLTREGLKAKEDVRMPEEVVRQTREGYVKAYEMLTGKKWE